MITMPTFAGPSGIARKAANRLPSSASRTKSSCETAAPDTAGIGGSDSPSKHMAREPTREEGEAPRLRWSDDGGAVATRRDERRNPGPAGAPGSAALDRRAQGAAGGAARAGGGSRVRGRLRAGGAGPQEAAVTAVRTLALVLFGTLVVCGTAAAHGDPASLYLHTRQVFIPTDVKFETAKKQRLTEVVAAANDAGFPIRVGLVANSHELGAALQLSKRPRVYAEFAGEELKNEAKYRG